jgi:hypothetical protein
MSTTTTAAEQSTKIVIGPVRFSYLKVWQPDSVEEGGEKKYSVSLIIPKSDKALIKKINEAINAAKEQGKANKFGGKIPGSLKLPLRDGDTDRSEDEAYENSYFINASCKTKPGVVDKNRQPVLNQDEVYSGCFGYASITFYAFNTSGNKGIAAGLIHIMKSKDGVPLGGRSTAEYEFAELDFDDTDDLM